MALNPGDTLNNNHYRIIRQLGRGGFGFVYLAQDTLLGEEVAIKELIPALMGDEAMLKRFLAEARATMRLTHRHIVRTYNVFQEGENYYIVMEYMAGGSLEERLRERGPLPVDEAVRMAAEVCAGLACAHEEQVVHCDLKPANILFDARGRAKVADFGIAHVSGEMLTRSWHTPAGFVAGTLPYMSPEQADGVRDEPRIDVYALGAVLYRALAGQTYLAFDPQETPRAQAQNVGRIYSEEPAPPSEHNRGIPAWLDGVVLRALAKRPEERYASAEALRAALLRQQAPAEALPPTRLVAKRPAPAPPPPAARQTPSRPVERAVPAAPVAGAAARSSPLPTWFWPAAGAAAVLIVFLILAIVSLGSGRDGGAVAGIGTATDAGPTETAVAAQTATRTPEPEIVPTQTNAPTSTPTDTPQPTATPTSTPTDTLEPTATSTSRPTATLQPTPTNTPVPPTNTPRPKAPAAGATQTRRKDGMVMVYVPAGKFLMGSTDADSQAHWDEKPQRTVTLDGFWIDRTAVTNAQYEACVRAGVCRVADMNEYDPQGKPKYPVVQVTWAEAKTYCEWAGARLPTEAEWEKAARGTDGRKYPWGNSTPDCNKAQYDECGGEAVPMGSRTAGASTYGVLDMPGNVWEWVVDWYDAYYYSYSPSRNPKGPDSGDFRSMRGGSWCHSFDLLRAANRHCANPNDRFDHVGFRCVADSP